MINVPDADRFKDGAIQFFINDEMRQPARREHADAQLLRKLRDRSVQRAAKLHAAFGRDRIRRIISIDQHRNHWHGSILQISAMDIRKCVSLILIGTDLFDRADVEAIAGELFDKAQGEIRINWVMRVTLGLQPLDLRTLVPVGGQWSAPCGIALCSPT